MTLAEIVLRIGGGLGGWLLFIAHALVIAVVPRADCDPASDEMWIGTLALAAVTVGAVPLLELGMGLPSRESTRWLAVLALPLAGLAAVGVAPALVGTTLDGGPLCAIAGALPANPELAARSATGVQRIWPMAQLLVLAACSAQAFRYWRRREPPKR
jgi:hypothetical protein